jgi:hypothetical protein
MRMTFVLALALLQPLASMAAPADPSSALDACGALSQAGMRACLTQKAADSQAALKRAEKDAAAGLSRWDEDATYAKRTKERLADASREFERYREAQCAFASSLGGGAIASALELRRLACAIELNEARAASLVSSIAALPRR